MTATVDWAEQLLQRLVTWARGVEDILGVVVIGSRARTDVPADEWSDLDVVLVTTNPGRYLETTDWIEALGQPWLTFLEATPVGGLSERRVMFEGARDLDVVPIHDSLIPAAIADPSVAQVLTRGARVLLDKDDRLSSLGASEPIVRAGAVPGSKEFANLVSDFWYHAVWAAKKLRRGELWVAKAACDGYMKALLLEMLEWHARTSPRRDHDTWHGGRFLERWTEPTVLEALRLAFARYDASEVALALVATMDLFRVLAREVADRLGHGYPVAADQRVTEWVTARLEEAGFAVALPHVR